MGDTTDRTRGSILILDDEPLKRITLQIELGEAGFHVVETSDAKTALRIVETQPVDVIVTDLKMPGMDGLTFLEHVRERRTDVPVIVMTAFGTVDTAVEAMKRGAYDYLTKPFKTDALLAKIEHLLSYKADQGRDHPTNGQQKAACHDRVGRLVARSHAMQLMVRQLQQMAGTDRPVLIRGERGTGKALVAEALHDASNRRDQPLRKITCTGLSPDTIEQALFGNSQGTVYVEEVEALPTCTQAKLADALSENPSKGQDRPLCARVVCGTAADLATAVKGGAFREDLYYRLSVHVLRVPALRDRKDDLPVLVRDLVARHRLRDDGSTEHPVSPHVMDLLLEHDWPGNLRELELVIERAIAACSQGEIKPDHLPPLGSADNGGDYAIPFAETGGRLNETVANIERKMIESALLQAGHNQAKAAQILGIPRTTLRDKIAKYGLVGGLTPPGSL